MIDIVISGSAARIDGRIRQVGERVSVPEHTALAFIRAGRAVEVPLVERTARTEPQVASHTQAHNKNRGRR